MNTTPLYFSLIKAWYRQPELIASSDRGGTYSLQINNPDATTPEYDLLHFRQSINYNGPFLQPGPVIKSMETPPVKKTLFSPT